MRIKSDGKVGFNTINPPRDYCFHSAQADTNIQITNSTTGVDDSAGALIQQDGNDFYVWNKENGFFSFATNASEKMRINSSGNVLIGDTTDSIYNDTTGGGINLKGDGQLVLAKQATSSGDPLIWLNDTGQTTNKSIVFAQDGAEKANIGLAGNDATVTVNGTERMRIDSNGRFRVPGRGINVAANSDISFSDYGFSGGGDTDGVLARHSGNAYLSVDDHFRIRDNVNNNENKSFEFNTSGGNAGADGNWNSNNFDFAEMLEWSDGNPNAEDRIGYSVAVDNLTGKIKITEEGDVPIGIVSGTASFVANAGELQWAGRRQRDEWGRFIYEPAVTVDDEGNEVPLLDDEGNQRIKPAVNPDWDETRYESYVPRSQRPEWACVGVVGQVYMRKGCPVDARWIKLKEVDSVKDLWLIR